MSDNPYAPPKTPVVDSDPALVPMERPNEIMAAIWLAFINYGLGVVVVLLSWDYYSKLQTLGGFLGSQAFSLAILCWLYYKIYVGRNWARMVVLVFMAIGVYSVNNNPFDLLVMAVFGLFGLACMKLGMEPAPLALGVVLGPLMEENLRRAMLLSRGDPTVFLTRPISAGFIIASVLMLLLLSLPALRRKREQVFAEEEAA